MPNYEEEEEIFAPQRRTGPPVGATQHGLVPAQLDDDEPDEDEDEGEDRSGKLDTDAETLEVGKRKLKKQPVIAAAAVFTLITGYAVASHFAPKKPAISSESSNVRVPKNTWTATPPSELLETPPEPIRDTEPKSPDALEPIEEPRALFDSKDDRPPPPRAAAEAPDPVKEKKPKPPSIFFGGISASTRDLNTQTPSTSATPGTGPEAAEALAAARDNAAAGGKEAFVANGRSAYRSNYNRGMLEAPLSPYQIDPGTVIPAALQTAINSDLPGTIFARVTRDVYDSAQGDHLLIPQGSQLIADYDSNVAWGQERVLMCWSLLVLPEGRGMVNLDCFSGADMAGASGLKDKVDNHWGRLIAASGMSTILSLGSQAIAGDPQGFQPSIAQQAAQNAAGQINNVGQRIVQRGLSIQPTLTVREGWPFIVKVEKALILEPIKR